MSPKISVIIPVYNTESTLHKCVDSILNQSYEDWELLLIDDGSKDHSAFICDEYAQQDKRIKVFHKENGGVSSARNIGIDNAEGKWITFIDSDDWVERNYLSNLYQNDENDIVASYYVAEGWKEWVSAPFKDYVYNEKQMKEFLTDCLLKFIFPYGKLFRHSIIKRYNLRFDESLSYGEDTLFIYQFLQYIKSVRISSEVTYHYICYGIGLSKQNFSWRIYWDILEKLLKAIHNLEHIFKWDGKEICNETVMLIIKRYIYYISSIHSIPYIRKELISILKSSVIKEAIEGVKVRSWKGKFINWLMLHDYLWISAILLYLKKRKS
ncbi:glycosyltransferase family 2 protein [Phocaeicola coprophilus]|jgi:glycosyltransferase involved in cell wall biosynthesis|uniref:Glycosyltransferase family 2 protein n=1 Tax=Phocaeicola coprophilus TaxID=387090 RepID=A0A413SX36_9BACT|nr:glycosyltransferase family 2 protein [Phocaeicola coprophilus]RHA73906.1 glycosyltransferase family 2 protein [Phocaeicola coprophilus]